MNVHAAQLTHPKRAFLIDLYLTPSLAVRADVTSTCDWCVFRSRALRNVVSPLEAFTDDCAGVESVEALEVFTVNQG